MKSTEKIIEAMNILNRSGEVEDSKRCQALLRQFLIDNTPTPKGQLTCAMFVSKETEIRPQMCCVYHDNERKVAVATNAFAMYYSEEEYQHTEGNGLRNVYGDDPATSYVDKAEKWHPNECGRFPNWQRVWPTDSKTFGTLVEVVMREDLENAMKACKAEMRLRKHKYGSVKVSANGNIWMDVDFAGYILQAGTDGWKVNADGLEAGNRAICKELDGQGLLLMPLVSGNEDNGQGWTTGETRS